MGGDFFVYLAAQPIGSNRICDARPQRHIKPSSFRPQHFDRFDAQGVKHRRQRGQQRRR
jgi:hypothetical protein